MSTIGQYPPTVACHYCGREARDTPEGYAHPVCYTCRLESDFSDTWKEEYGMRPRFPATHAYMEEWLASVGR